MIQYKWAFVNTNFLLAFSSSDQVEQAADNGYRSAGAARYWPEPWPSGPHATSRGSSSKSQAVLSLLDTA